MTKSDLHISRILAECTYLTCVCNTAAMFNALTDVPSVYVGVHESVCVFRGAFALAQRCMPLCAQTLVFP